MSTFAVRLIKCVRALDFFKKILLQFHFSMKLVNFPSPCKLHSLNPLPRSINVQTEPDISGTGNNHVHLLVALFFLLYLLVASLLHRARSLTKSGQYLDTCPIRLQFMQGSQGHVRR